jgi:two-component system cell cycle response regulator DivK
MESQSDNEAARGTSGGPGRLRSAANQPPRRRFTVLIADDTAHTRELYEEYFTARGFNVVTANDGANAIQAALEHVPDVVIMDLAMPEFDGITAVHRLKQSGRLRNTGIIMLTGYPSIDIGRAALQIGVDLFLTKPCLPEHLERHINQLRSQKVVDSRSA